MLDFEFISPTKIYFGKDKEKQIGEILYQHHKKRCLIVYGQSSIFKLGLYDLVKASLNEYHIECYELGGILPNPRIDKVREGVKIVKDYDIDSLLAIGGGSVIDTAKLIGVSALVDFDPWEFFLGKKPIDTIDVYTILTISAAGSELSNSCVINNPQYHLKRGFNSDIIRPKVAILNPALTFSVSKYQTACGIVDILMHTLERYLVLDDSPLAFSLAEGLMKTVLEYGKIAYLAPTNYEARAVLMLSSSLSHNGLTGMGSKMYFTVHKLEHELSGFYEEIAHGAGLSVLFLAWARYLVNDYPELFKKLAINVLGIDNIGDDLVIANKGIDYLEDYFKFLNMPTRLRDFNITNLDIEGMANSVTANKLQKVVGFKELSFEDVLKIYQLSL